MKQFIAILAVAVAALCFYKFHVDQLRLAAEKAEAAARAGRASQTKGQVQLKAVGLSRVIEPLYTQLFSKVDASDPVDVAPPIEITTQRILDKRAYVEPDKQRVFDLGINLLREMLPIAEERTKVLQSLVQAAASNHALESRGSTSNSGAFFAQGLSKRWESDKKRHKSRLDQLFTQLREAEREWNQRLGERAPVEAYDLPAFAPLHVTAEPAVASSNPLEIDLQLSSDHLPVAAHLLRSIRIVPSCSVGRSIREESRILRRRMPARGLEAGIAVFTVRLHSGSCQVPRRS